MKNRRLTTLMLWAFSYLCTMQNPLSLYELNKKIKHGLEALFPFPVWIVAEISEIQSRRHCYLELVERDKEKDMIVAKSRATIWARTYNLLKPYFETTTGYELSEGLKVLVQVEVQFSELYGLSLNIKDIDPNYTLGDLEQRKQRIIQQLKEEGIYEMNKSLLFPTIPKNIAIISSEKAAGYQDFIKQLHQNSLGYKFHTHLFPALMQGNEAEKTIIQALEQIYEYENIFDAVVIIRGGGAVSDLSCFDSYELAANIAQFPLPILTGIGHDKDQSVADEVAYRSLKTPTAVADFLIDCFQLFEEHLFEITATFSHLIKNSIIDRERHLLNQKAGVLCFQFPSGLRRRQQNLSSITKELRYVVKAKLSQEKNRTNNQERKLPNLLENYCARQKERLKTLEYSLDKSIRSLIVAQKENLSHKKKLIELLAPDRLLKRGYSITTCKGKLVKDVAQLSKGDEVVTQLKKGTFKSTVR